jgi:hypothetical protein
MRKTRRKCQGTYIDMKTHEERQCRRSAVTKRKWWRFGGKNEPTIVEFYTHLCTRCSADFDECQREAAWEAHVS